MALDLSSGKCIARCYIEDDAGPIDASMALRMGGIRRKSEEPGQTSDLVLERLKQAQEWPPAAHLAPASE